MLYIQGFLFFAPVSLFAGWLQNYKRDLHETWWKDGTWAEKKNDSILSDPDKGADVVFLFSFFKISKRTFYIFNNFKQNNIYKRKIGIFRGMISMNVSN